MVIRKNVFWIKNKADYIFRQIDVYNNYNYGSIDSNYYFQPYNSIDSVIYRLNGLQLKPYSFNTWQAAAFDVHTKTNNFRWATNIDSSKLFVNPTDNAVTQDLQGFQWKDLDGNIITSLILQPWTSKILIKTVTLLPVEIVSYDVRVTNEKQVLNTWAVANEINLSNYNIQRSSNGRNFETIGTVAAKGLQEYNFTDNITTNYTTLYYRIEAVDKDGSKTYSTMKQITIKRQTSNISIYPNPAKDVLNVLSNKNIKSIKIINQLGLVLVNRLINNVATSINITSLQKGMYYVVVADDENECSLKTLIIL